MTMMLYEHEIRREVKSSGFGSSVSKIRSSTTKFWSNSITKSDSWHWWTLGATGWSGLADVMSSKVTSIDVPMHELPTRTAVLTTCSDGTVAIEDDSR